MCIPEAMIICLTRMNIYPERAVKNLYIIFSQNRNAAGMQSLQSMRLKLSGLYPPPHFPLQHTLKIPRTHAFSTVPSHIRHPSANGLHSGKAHVVTQKSLCRMPIYAFPCDEKAFFACHEKLLENINFTKF